MFLLRNVLQCGIVLGSHKYTCIICEILITLCRASDADCTPPVEGFANMQPSCVATQG